MAINYLLILIFFIATSIVVSLVIKSIDEKELLDNLVKDVSKDPNQRNKYKDIYLQKKSKIMFIRAAITAIVCTVGLKFYIDNQEFFNEPKKGGCGCAPLDAGDKVLLPF